MGSICIKTGNYLNYYYVRFTYYDSLNFKDINTKLKIKPLSNKKAAELGSEMIAESLLTMIPVTFLIITLNRKYKEEMKLQNMQTNIQSLTDKYANLYELVNTMQSELIQLNHKLIQQMEEQNETEHIVKIIQQIQEQ